MDIKAFVKNDINKLGKIATPKNIGKVTMGLTALLALANMAKDKADQEAQTNEVVERVLKKLSSGEQ
jgi:hypothetical protein